MLAADLYTPVDDTLIPTGEITSVQGTPLDFTRPATLGSRIAELKGEPGGYDHNYVLRSGGKELALAARVTEPVSGRILEMFTTEPAVQLYTANFLDGTLKGKDERRLQEAASVLPRGPALSRLGQSAQVSVNHPSTRINIHPDDDLQVQRELDAAKPRSSNQAGRRARG